MKFALFFRFFDSWYIIKYLLTKTSGKQYVLWTLDSRGSTKHTVSLGLNQQVLIICGESLHFSDIYLVKGINKCIQQSNQRMMGHSIFHQYCPKSCPKYTNTYDTYDSVQNTTHQSVPINIQYCYNTAYRN